MLIRVRSDYAQDTLPREKITVNVSAHVWLYHDYGVPHSTT